MDLQIEKLYLTAEYEPQHGEITSTDVVISLNNGGRYIASFFSFQEIERLRTQHHLSGDYMCGKYFWTDRFLLIDNCNRKLIREVVEHLIDEGDFKSVFKKIN